MKQKLVIALVYLTLITNGVLGQNNNKFVPIKLLDYTPKWFYYVEDSTAIGVNPNGQYDYISQFVFVNCIVQDSFVYNLYSTRLLNREFDGSYVEKRNIMSGKRIWGSIFDMRTIDNNEKPSRMILNGDGELEIMGFRCLDRITGNKDPNINAKLFIRRLNTETGALVYYKYAAVTDSLSPIIYPGNIYSATRIIEYGTDKYQYLYNKGWPQWYKRYSYIMNGLGRLEDIKEIVYDSVGVNFWLGRFSLLNDSVFALIRTVMFVEEYPGENYYYKIYIERYDRDLNMISSVDISDIMKVNHDFFYLIEYADDDYFVLDYRNEPEYFDWKHYYYIFDYKGNLLDSINTYPEDHDFYLGTIKRVSNKEFLVVGTSIAKPEKNFTMYIYKKKIGEPIKLLKEIKLGPEYYAGVVDYIEILSNGDYLFYGASGYKNTKYYNIELAWPFCMYVASEDLKATSIEVYNQNDSTNILIYPNPAKEKITIEFPNVFTGILEIVDEMGRVFVRKSIKEKVLVKIDLMGLAAGTYMVIANDGKDVIGVKSLFKQR